MKGDPLDAIDRASLLSSSSSSSSSSEDTTKKPRRASSALRRQDSGGSDESDIEYLYRQNFHELREQCLKEGKLFEDPEFPADNDLLRVRSARHLDDIEWLRPHEFVKGGDGVEPVLVSERNEGFDVRVGLDSWFVPAMAAVAESEAMLRQVVPDDQGFTHDKKYAGILHFRFWFGRWIEIVIDDRIPCRGSYGDKTPMYLRSARPEEMWPALLEKAYAKAKGSYELLNHWMPIDGCIELTGGVPERVRCLPDLLKCEDARAADRLFQDVARACQMGNIVLVQPPKKKTRDNRLCLAEAQQLGLQVKYTYRVTQVADLGDGKQLVRVKNSSGPGFVEWSGAWHPGDSRWAKVDPDIKARLDDGVNADGGGFWMAYGDFLKYFKTLDICHLSHDVDQVITFHGRWEVGLNAGGVQRADFKNFARNPQCFIRLSDPDPVDDGHRCSAVISLMQRREPKSRAKGLNKIGFKIFRVDDAAEELTSAFFSYRRHDGQHKCVAKTPTWQDGRETNVRVRLPRAKYCIVPCTFMPDREGDFILRVHIERYSREGNNSNSAMVAQVEE